MIYTSNLFLSLIRKNPQKVVEVLNFMITSLTLIENKTKNIENKLDQILKEGYHRRTSRFYEAKGDIKTAKLYEEDKNQEKRNYYLEKAISHFRAAYNDLMDHQEQEMKLKIYSLYYSGVCCEMLNYSTEKREYYEEALKRIEKFFIEKISSQLKIGKMKLIEEDKDLKLFESIILRIERIFEFIHSKEQQEKKELLSKLVKEYAKLKYSVKMSFTKERLINNKTGKITPIKTSNIFGGSSINTPLISRNIYRHNYNSPLLYFPNLLDYTKFTPENLYRHYQRVKKIYEQSKGEAVTSFLPLSLSTYSMPDTTFSKTYNPKATNLIHEKWLSKLKFQNTQRKNQEDYFHNLESYFYINYSYVYDNEWQLKNKILHIRNQILKQKCGISTSSCEELSWEELIKIITKKHPENSLEIGIC